jgi:hypothetical protein
MCVAHIWSLLYNTDHLVLDWIFEVSIHQGGYSYTGEMGAY